MVNSTQLRVDSTIPKVSDLRTNQHDSIVATPSQKAVATIKVVRTFHFLFVCRVYFLPFPRPEVQAINVVVFMDVFVSVFFFTVQRFTKPWHFLIHLKGT